MKSNTPLTVAQIYQFVLGNFDQIGEETYEGLYAYYTSHERGDDAMPYGTAKARDGDPYLWIEMQLRKAIEAESGMTMSELNEMALGLSVRDFEILYTHEAIHRQYLKLMKEGVLGGDAFGFIDNTTIEMVTSAHESNEPIDAAMNAEVKKILGEKTYDAVIALTQPIILHDPSKGNVLPSIESLDKTGETK